MQLSVVSARLSVCKSVSLDGWEGRLACLKHLFFLFWILAALSESADGQSVSCLGALRESLQLQSAKAHQILKWQNIQSTREGGKGGRLQLLSEFTKWSGVVK